MADGDLKKKKQGSAAERKAAPVKKKASVKKAVSAKKGSASPKKATQKKSAITKTTRNKSSVAAKVPSSGQKEHAVSGERARKYAALISFCAVVLFAMLLFKPFGSVFGPVDSLVADAKGLFQQKEYGSALDRLKAASKKLRLLEKGTARDDQNRTKEIAKRKRRIERLARAIREARAKDKLRADSEVQRLMRRAKQDESIGLYKRALDKMDKALDLLDRMERGQPEDKHIQKIWKKKIDALRKKVNDLRRRLAQKQKKDEQSQRGSGSDDTTRQLSRRIQELQKRLDAASARDRKRLEQALKRAQDEKRRRDEQRKRGTRDNSNNGNRSKDGRTVLRGSDVKTKVKDVRTKSKTKVDYDKGEGIEK